jgi:hypothetical protein
MAVDQAVTTITIEAGADLSALQYRFIELDGTLPSGAGGEAHGVNYGKADASGKAVTLAVAGVVKVEAGAAVTAMDKVQSDATGRAITAASGDHVLGTALTAAAGAGEIIEVLLGSHHILV